MRFYKIFRYVVLTMALLLFVGHFQGFAQSRKGKNKQSIVSKIYHNTVARYNGYYNSKVKIKATYKLLTESHEDNYREILDIYPFLDTASGQSSGPEMDAVVKKTSKVTDSHKKSKWVDDCYLLLGQAYFYKGEYEDALETFLYITTNFKVKPLIEKKTKRTKKAYKRQQRNKLLMKIGFKHKPIYHEAVLWLIFSYLQSGHSNDAQTLIELVRNDLNFPKKLLGKLDVLQTEVYIQQDELGKAANALAKGIELTKKRKLKHRYTFILAQIYQEIGENRKAVNTYHDLLKMNADYELEFYAKLNIARSYEAGGEVSIENVKRQLQRLAKDEKNKEFLDQIYFLLAELELKDNNKNAAIKYLKLSVANNVDNTDQKTLSYLTLADLYYEDYEYRTAKVYYDSTLLLMTSDEGQYKKLLKKNDVLEDLVINLDIIQTQDSLRRIANMTDKERKKFIKNLKAKADRKIELERSVALSETSGGSNFLGDNTSNTLTTSSNKSSTWYFYNNNSKSIGYSDFLSKWGNRSLEDNWRRSQKFTFNFEKLESDSSIVIEEQVNANEMSEEDYYKNLPLTNKQMETSDNLLIEAFYNVGVIFYEQLFDFPNSIQSFEELQKRFPDNKYSLQVYYYLYTINAKLPNKQKAEYYKNLIVTKYPNSIYAIRILDPDFVNESKKEIQDLLKLYESSYLAYQNNQLQFVYDGYNTAKDKYPSNYLMPKFTMLKALSHAKQEDLKACKNMLLDITLRYPNDPVKTEAEYLLDYLNKKDNKTTIYSSLTSIYKFEPEALHYWIVVMKNEFDKVNDLMNAISDYNEMYYSLDRLEVNLKMLDRDIRLVMVQVYPNKKKVLDYHKFTKDEQAVFAGIDPESYDIIVISANNFKKFYQRKNTEEYLDFFNITYLK